MRNITEETDIEMRVLSQQNTSPAPVVTTPQPPSQPVVNLAPVAIKPKLPPSPRVNSALFQQPANSEQIIKIACVGDRHRKLCIANLALASVPAAFRSIRHPIAIDFFLHLTNQKLLQIWHNVGYNYGLERSNREALNCKGATAVIIIPKDADELRYYCTDSRYHGGENCQLFFLDIELADQPRTTEETTALHSMASRFPDLIKLQYQYDPNNLAVFCKEIEAALNNKKQAVVQSSQNHRPGCQHQ